MNIRKRPQKNHAPADHLCPVLVRPRRKGQPVLSAVGKRPLVKRRIEMRQTRRARVRGVDALHRVHILRVKADFRDIGFLPERMGMADDAACGMDERVLLLDCRISYLGMRKQPFFIETVD